MPLNLFIIGPSGCGKSTQAKLLAEKYNLTHFSMGKLLREEIAKGSKLGQKVKPYVDNGTWAPDDIVLPILKGKLKSIGNQNFIIDGFPRLLHQGIAIDNYLHESNEPTTALIHLAVKAQEIIDRRKEAAKEGERFSDPGRTDETPEAIAQRQKSYDDTINPIKGYFTQHNKLIEVDGNRPIEPIFGDICQIIDKINN
jgi:adenylate kinase